MKNNCDNKNILMSKKLTSSAKYSGEITKCDFTKLDIIWLKSDMKYGFCGQKNWPQIVLL